MEIKNKRIGQFISDLVELCIKEGVEFKLTNKKHILLSGLPCNGYFEGDVEFGKLFVATGKSRKEWLPILVHESCHLDQWLEDKSKFIKDDGIELIDEWLAGKRINKLKIKKAITNSKKLELDCEKRVIEKIKRYKLPINIDTYIQMSNAYVYFYEWVYQNRTWPLRKLHIPEIYNNAPKEFQKSYNSIPKELEEAFNKYLK